MAAQNRQKIVVKITFVLCAKFYLHGDHIVSHAKFPERYVIRRANDRGTWTERQVYNFDQSTFSLPLRR